MCLCSSQGSAHARSSSRASASSFCYYPAAMPRRAVPPASPLIPRAHIPLFSHREQNVARGKGPDLSYPQFYLAGAGAGLTNSIVSGPVEHIRIRLQTQTKNAAGAYPYSGPFDACKKIYATDGMRGIFYGQGATLLR